MLSRWDYHGTQATLRNGNPAWSTEYDYTTDTFRTLTLVSNVFCVGGALLPDARLITVGGAENYTDLGGLENGEQNFRYIRPSGSTGSFGNADWVDEPSNPDLTLLVSFQKHTSTLFSN